jgi:DNA polymerase-3 subunit gamma/tau
MSSLYQKYRPKSFSEITGQEHIVRTLSNSIKNNRIGHAYLFTGSRGIGKTTLARIFAKTINCLEPKIDHLAVKKDEDDAIKNKNRKKEYFPVEPCGKCKNCQLVENGKAIDLIEIDAASYTGVDNIRLIKENVQSPPINFRYKIYIIDEVHMLSTGAFNALLKTLEEPPRHAVFILATTEIHKVPDTIISRCQRFDFKRFTTEQIIKRLKKIAQKEKIEIDQEALEMIALEAEGGMRDAESLMQQIISIEDKEITAEEVFSIIGSSSKKSSFEFVIYFLRKDIKKILAEIEEFQTKGKNLKNIQKNIISFLRDFLLFKANPNDFNKLAGGLTSEQKRVAQEIIQETSFEDLIFAIEVLQKNLNLFKDTSLTQLPLELSAVEFYLRTFPEEKKLPAKKEAPPLKPEKTLGMTSQKVARDNKEPSAAIKAEEDPESALDQTNGKSLPKKSEGNLSLKSIMDKWSQILDGVKPFNHSIHAFLKNCAPLALENNTFFIKTKYDFYKERLNDPQNRLTIKKTIDKIVGCNIKISVLTEREARRMNFQNKDQPDNQQDNVLYDAMKMMGGRIVS